MLFIVVRGVFTGEHNWPDAGAHGYPRLAWTHPHVFHFRAVIPVERSRQVEFQSVALWIAKLMQAHLKHNPMISCEDLAERTMVELRTRDLKATEVEVNEDGWSGAIVTCREEEPSC